MRHTVAFFLIFLTLGSCISHKYPTRNLTTLRNPDKLKSDVDFAYHKLQTLHPRLYEYTPKEVLDFKFDSLKSELTTPMTSNEFYFWLAPVIAAVGQGHALLQPLEANLSFSQKIKLASGSSPLSQYEFEKFNDKLYITRNISGNKGIKPGTEVVTVNGIDPDWLISKYRPAIPSDGFNTTFRERKLGTWFPLYYYYYRGMADTLNCVLKFNDTLSKVTLTRPERKISLENLKSKEQRTAEKPVREMAREKAEEQGYDPQTKTWSKNLTFTSPDSSIAILTVRDFSNGAYTDYYRKCFRMLDSLKTETLILDIRDNPGGNAPDAACLFSYLTDTGFIFHDKAEVVSKNSITKYRYFRGNPLLINMILAVGYPMQLLHKGVLRLMTQQGPDQKYYASFPESDSARPKKKHFRGDLYVVINGGTFSAAATLASNLKGINRGTFVGEETGGSANGTVAGKMALIKLPESNLWFTFGLAHIQPHYHSGLPGRGVMPDVEIKPTLQDRINGVDPEIRWVVDHL